MLRGNVACSGIPCAPFTKKAVAGCTSRVCLSMQLRQDYASSTCWFHRPRDFAGATPDGSRDRARPSAAGSSTCWPNTMWILRARTAPRSGTVPLRAVRGAVHDLHPAQFRVLQRLQQHVSRCAAYAFGLRQQRRQPLFQESNLIGLTIFDLMLAANTLLAVTVGGQEVAMHTWQPTYILAGACRATARARPAT